MAKRKNNAQAGDTTSATVGYEAELWKMADALRGSMDAAEYKHVVLGLIFLKYISDAFEEQHRWLEAERAQGADPEDPDEYRAHNIFWVPPEARWSHLKAQAKQPTIGQLVDDAMAGIERDNPALKGVLPKDYARPALDKTRLGQLIDLISNLDFRSDQPSPQPSPKGRGSESQYRGGYDFSGLVERAREHRNKQTPAEELLWQLLRNRQLCDAKFRRQHQVGDYIADFYCHDAKLVIECDGTPHDKPARVKHDARRDVYLRSQGLKVLRFTNKRILRDTEAVLKEIAAELVPSHPGRRTGDEGRHAHDLLGRVYEYFLAQFASAEGKKGGEFYTPRCVVKLLVEMLEPYRGRVYDPCCGSSGMFVQSVEFIRAHATGNGNGGRARADISIYGQESNYTTWRLAKMNLAIRGIEGQIAHGDTFHDDLFPDLKADYILANPPFNVSDWGGDRLLKDVRWKFGVPPKSNANFAWVQHIIHHLAPKGVAGFVLANGSMSSNQSGEGEIRKNIIEADLVDCMVALPGQLFYSTQIPACLWFLARDKKNSRFRHRRGQVLFIDARKMGRMVDRTHRELTDEDIQKIASTYHAWRGEKDAGEYADVAGFCKSATLEDIRNHGYVLTPGRYVGAAPQEDDGEPFEEKMQRLVAQLREQQDEAARLDAAIARNLEELGYGH